jgi:hypothetical protein
MIANRGAALSGCVCALTGVCVSGSTVCDPGALTGVCVSGSTVCDPGALTGVCVSGSTICDPGALPWGGRCLRLAALTGAPLCVCVCREGQVSVLLRALASPGCAYVRPCFVLSSNLGANSLATPALCPLVHAEAFCRLP